MKLFAFISDLSLAALLLGIAVLIVFILVLLVFVLLRRKATQQQAPAESTAHEAAPQEDAAHSQEASAARARTEGIEPSVSSAVQFLNQNSSGRGSGYGTPWFLALGASNSGKSTLLDNSGISLSLRGGAADFGRAQGIKWRFFDAGVILDVPGALFVEADKNVSDEPGWKELLRNLHRRRPQRAIDGVVLTIPCTELIGDGALSPALIGQRAAFIFDKLWQIQKWLGFCYPVYVVITKCDLIPGFKSLARQLPAHYQREMFGWSNPYNLDAAFDSSWIDQAFDELAGNVHRLQSEVFVERRHIADVDELFLFSARLQELRRPLRIYLSQTLKQSAYRESLQFRGFYFTGDATELAEEEPMSARAMAAAASSSSSDIYPEITGNVLGLEPVHRTAQHAPIFVTDLFETKIFPERALARPVSRVRLSKNRMVLGTQAACLVAAIVLMLGMIFGYLRLSHAQSHGLSHLTIISKRLKDHTHSKHPVNDVDTILAPLNVMEDLTGHHHFKSVFIPSSFLMSVDDEITAAMGPAFEQIMYKGIRQELVERGQALFDDQVVANSTDGGSIAVVSIKDVPSYQKLHEFTDGVISLEENVARYNKVAAPGGGDAESLLSLAKYVAGSQFQKEFDATLKQHDSYLNEIVLQSHGEPLEPNEIATPQESLEKMQDYVRAVFTEWLPPDGRVRYLDDLAKKLDAFDRQELHTYAQLNDLKMSLSEAQQVLSSPEFAWMNQDKINVVAPLQDTMDRITLRPIDQQLFLCNTAASQDDFCPQLEALKRFIAQSEVKDLDNFRTALLSKETKVTGELLDSEGDVLQLSPAANKVLSLLNTMLKLPFVEREGTAEIQTSLDKNQQLLWQKEELDTAIQYKQSYDDFLKGEFESAPSNVQEAFQNVALMMLEQNMVDMVEQAEHLGPLPPPSSIDQSITPEVQSLKESTASLNTLLASFQDLGFDDAQHSLLSLTTTQASHLLLRIDAAFEAQEPYARDVSFGRWDSDNTPSRAGFDVHNPDEMTQYLAYQRQQAQQYAALAAPVVSFLETRIPAGGKEPGRTLLKWQRIIAELDKIQAKVPGTSVAALEDFIGTQIDKATPENCQAGFLANAAAKGGDYFVQTRESIRQSLYNQCRLLAGQDAVRSYGQLARFFNQHLAGRFPFSGTQREPMPSEADPQDVAEMFRLLNASGKIIHAGLQSGNFGNSYSSVLAFLNQMEGLAPLFSAMTTTDVDPVPVFDVVPVFRVNQGREINGNQIIDWTLQVGSDTFHFRDPQRAGRWNYGEPVKLTLRWAKDSPQQPVSSPSAFDSKLSSRSVVFEYRDSWSLFTMMALHQPVPNDFDRMTDPEPQTLVFLVNDGKSSDPAAQASVPQARVFVRLKLRLPGKPDNLRLRGFPSEAPLLTQNNTTAANGAGTGGEQQ